MAQQLTIKAKKREDKTPNKLRADGFIPATVYGHGFNSKSVQVNAKEFSKVPHKAYSRINQLSIEQGENFPILIRNVQSDPVRDYVLNIEFYRIKSDEKIKIKVPINYIGHSEAVVAGGVLIVSHNEIEVQCLPQDIPDALDADLGQIVEIGQSICAKDLKVPETIHILANPNEVLAKVEIPKTHEVEEEVPAVAEGEVPVAGEAPAEGQAAEAQEQPSKEADKPTKK